MKSTLLWGLLCSSVPLCTSGAVFSDTLIRERVHPIDSVLIRGAGSLSRDVPGTAFVLDRGQIVRGGRSSLLPSLSEHVPGLFITGRGIMGFGVSGGASGQMNLRGVGSGASGGPTTGLLVLIDGQPQYMGLMGHPIADAYQSLLAERVEVTRGPASVLYGSNAMGGVVNIITRKSAQDGVRTDLHAAYGSYNTLETELSNQVRKGRFTSTVSGSYNRSDGHRPHMGFGQFGGLVKLGVKIARAWNLSANADVTHFNAQNPGSVDAPLLDNIQHITRGVASAVVQNDYGRTSGSLGLFYNWGRHRINDGYSPGSQPLAYRFNSRDKMAGVSWHQSVALFRGNRTTFGADYRYFGGKAWNHYLDGRPDLTTADKTQHEVAGYIDLRQNLLHWFAVEAGIRLDRHSHAGTEWVPQGALVFRLPRQTQLRASVGKGFRFPTIREMYMFPTQNPDLRPERVVNYEIALSQTPGGGSFRYGVNVFYLTGDNMIQTLPVNGRPLNVNTGRIENAGVEADAAWRFARSWNLSANYSYLHMKYPIVAAPEHKVYGSLEFTSGRWNAATGLQYVRGLFSGLDPLRRENFLLWSARASFRAAKNLRLFVRGENLLAQRYEINAGYPMPKATVMAGAELHFQALRK